uniref:RNA helicase n=1 Tax=Loa loa TaxID=7209 RepID=A0A1I7W244_LOALO
MEDFLKQKAARGQNGVGFCRLRLNNFSSIANINTIFFYQVCRGSLKHHTDDDYLNRVGPSTQVALSVFICCMAVEVAYKVRFENTTSNETKIVYGTDGIFLRETFYDSLLTHYSVVIVDEAHERSIHTDIVIMSATLETNIFSEYFDDAPVYIVEGRTYPVEIFYANSLDKKDDDYVFNVLTAVLQIHRTEPLSSDVLAFLTGQEEIETACKKVQEASKLLTGGLIALPLYAGLPPSAQMRVFEPASVPYTRKIIFATNIAETSITIPGVRIIVDSGKIKVKTFLPDRHIDILRVENISQCSATQRAGRAGREAPGKCYRLYSEKHFHSLSKVTIPEILRSNLAVVLLELLRIGLRRIKSLALISNPRKEGLEAAEKHLRLLDAVKRPDKKGRLRLTEMGTKLSSFPVDPAFARALIAASQNECLEEVLTIVAFMSTDTVFVSSTMGREQTNLSKRKFEAPEGDHCTLLNVYRGFRLARKEKKLEEWCEANHVHQRLLNTVFKIRRQLRDICSKNSLVFRSCGADTDKLRRTLCQGLFMNACTYDRSQDRYNLLISPGTSLKIHPSSCLSRSRPSAFIFTDLVRTNELYARDITVIDLEWAKELLDSKKAVLNMFCSENCVR